jgi:hypothetical protein
VTLLDGKNDGFSSAACLSPQTFKYIGEVPRYDINGFTFYTIQQDGKKRNQNSGVHFDAHDENSNVETTYYGFIEEIWELDYGALKVPLFCWQ